MAKDSIHTESERVRKEATGLSTSRADFAATLTRRLESVVVAVDALEQQLDSPGTRDNLLRRVHALSASAKVLGFAAAADVLSRVEQRIRTSQTETLTEDLKLVRKYLADIPAMVHRGSYSIVPPPHATATTATPIDAELAHGVAPFAVDSGHTELPFGIGDAHTATPLVVDPVRAESRQRADSDRVFTEPCCVLLFGPVELERSLLSTPSAQSGFELTSSTNPDQLPQLAAALGPDVLLLDATQGSITLLVEELSQSPETAGIPIVALNVPTEAIQSLVDLGVRTALSSRANDQQILSALRQARKPVELRPRSLPPLGEVSLKELAERLAQEIQQGLVEAAGANAQTERISLGEGTHVRAALWSALAQIRQHVVEQSDGRIQFDQGPDGSIPLAPGPATTARRSSSSFGTVDLTGRRILVADDDPAVAWLVSGTLRAAGAIVTETHDGLRALELSYRLWPELIVSDILMPGLDGFALCHVLKRDVLLRDVPIVLLSWKEDLLFRLRDLGADADGYLRKEATASTVVQRVQELLRPRHALERRLAQTLTAKGTGEARGRLDATTVRLLLEIASSLEHPVRIALRDATALFDLRLREGTLKAITRTRNDGTVEHGESVLGALIGITAGRFSVTVDHEPCEPEFDSPLADLLRPVALRARAAQRVLSGLSLGLVEQLVLERDTVTEELSLLPLSLRTVAEELLRGVSPRQLLASGVASVHLLESLLSDIARRGAVRAITSTSGEDLLEQEILALSATPTTVPSIPAPAPTPLFTFQLSPAPPVVLERTTTTPTTVPKAAPAETRQPNPDTWGQPSGTLAGVGSRPDAVSVPPLVTASKAPPSDDVDWAAEMSWDSEPPPAKLESAPPSSPPSSRPLSSIGFMRPTFPVLTRRPQHETPDLANAVAKAVSEVTPVPVPAKSVDAPLGKPESIVPESIVPESIVPESIVPESIVPESIVPESIVPESIVPESIVPEQTKPEPILVDTKTVTALAGKNATSSQNETPLIPLETKDVSQAAPSLAETVSAPLACPPPLAGLGDITLGATTQTPTFGSKVGAVTPHPPSKLTAANPPSTLDAPQPELPLHAPHPTELNPLATHGTPPLPAVLKPPRPQEVRSTFVREHDSDPVFPLVSTTPHVLEIQPAIEISDPSLPSAHQGLPEPEPERAAPLTRDTLRSPGDSTPACDTASKIAIAEAPTAAIAEAPTAAATEAQLVPGTEPKIPETDLTSPPVAPAPTSTETETETVGKATPTSSAPPATSPTSRTVSWIQALGLSFLAGVVTFAITVPVARWVRDRPAPSHDDQQASSVGVAISPDASPSAVSPVTSAISDAAPTPPVAQPSATLETIPTPLDVTLAPGQGLIEIVTAAGHAIFVDDSFVGRGPVRVVTVTPGRHVVRTRLNGVERTDTVEIGAGRSMRLSLEQAWK